MVMGLIYVCWVDPFDGLDLVLVSYGLMGLIWFWFHMSLMG